MISVATLRRELNLGGDREELLELLRDTVVGLWESYTGALWDQRSGHVETRRVAEDTTLLQLSLRPVSSVTTVEEMDDDESDWTELEADEDFVSIGHTLRRRGTAWSPNVRITYSGGYTESTAPAQVRAALVTQARFMAKRLSNEHVEISSQNFEGGSGVFLRPDVHPLFALAAAPHRMAVG